MATHLVWLVGNRFDNSVCVCVYVYNLTMRKRLSQTEMQKVLVRGEVKFSVDVSFGQCKDLCLLTLIGGLLQILFFSILFISPILKQHYLSHNVYYVVNK